jgi:hypothetical protein
MGNLSDSVRALVDEITAATHNRRHHLQELTQETREARQEWRSELQEVSRSLSDHFASNRAQRATANRAQQDVTREFMDESHRAHQERARALGDHFAANRAERVTATREFMDEGHKAYQERARALGDSFAASRAQRATGTRARREMSHQLMDEIHRAYEQCRVTVSELRSDAHNTTERFGLERHDMVKVVQERLSSAGQALREAVQEVRDAAQAMVGELVADRRQAHQHWTEGLKKKLAPEPVAAEAVVATETVVPPAAVVEEVAAAVEAPSEVETARPLPLEERVLEVIARRPQGIRLVDIGNELGVDWRSLLGVSRTIVEEDKVERIDNLYYPKGAGPHEAGEEV